VVWRARRRKIASEVDAELPKAKIASLQFHIWSWQAVLIFHHTQHKCFVENGVPVT